MVIRWIQKIRIKKGVLHKQLGIPQEKKIPISILNKIIAAKPGNTIKNTSGIGRKNIKVTKLLEKRANLAKNLKSLKR